MAEEEEATEILLRSSENSRVLKTVIKNSITGVDPLLHTPTLFLHLPSLFSLPSLSPLCHMYQETHGSRPGAVVVHYSRFGNGRPVTHKPGEGGCRASGGLGLPEGHNHTLVHRRPVEDRA